MSEKGKENGKAGGVKNPAGSQTFPTFATATVKTPDSESSMKGKSNMSEAVMEAGKTIGMFAAFSVFYVPMIVAYINGSVDNFISRFFPDPDAPNFVKYGEASDY